MSQPATIQDKLALIAKYSGDLNSWEFDFINSIKDQLAREFNLSEKQRAALDKIYTRIERWH